MWAGKFSDRYSGKGIGRSQRESKANRRKRLEEAAKHELKKRAFQKAAYAEARAKSKEKRSGLPGILDELKNIFRRAS